MGMVAENAMAFGVNEALKRTFPDEAKEDPTLRPDLVKPFLMVSDHECFLDWFNQEICIVMLNFSQQLGCHYRVLLSNW